MPLIDEWCRGAVALSVALPGDEGAFLVSECLSRRDVSAAVLAARDTTTTWFLAAHATKSTRPVRKVLYDALFDGDASATTARVSVLSVPMDVTSPHFEYGYGNGYGYGYGYGNGNGYGNGYGYGDGDGDGDGYGDGYGYGYGYGDGDGDGDGDGP